MSQHVTDARSVRLLRRPVVATEYRGWTIEVYRIGRRHQYQGLAVRGGVAEVQTERRGGPGAMTEAGYQAMVLVDEVLAREPKEDRP